MKLIKKEFNWHKFYIIPFTSTNYDFKDILIVGSGTGNDVATAIRNSKGNIDAVEIDPLVANLGENFILKPIQQLKSKFDN